MVNLLNTGLILIFLGACGVLGNKKNILISSFTLPRWALILLGGFLFSVLTVNIFILMYLTSHIVVPKIIFFVLLMVFFLIFEESIKKIEYIYFNRYKEYSTYFQAEQLVTISPKMNVKATSKGKISSSTLKASQKDQKIIILGVGALSANPVHNYNATSKLYLTYSEWDPQRNYNMFQVNTCGGFVPNRGGVPYIKKVIDLERERLFRENSFSEHDMYLKAQHFKDMYRSSNTQQQPLSFDRGCAMFDQGPTNIVPTYAHITATRILSDCDRRSVWKLLANNNDLEQHVIVLHQTLTQERRNTEALRFENYRLSAAASRTVERLESVTVAKETLSYENRGLKAQVQDLITSTGIQREENFGLQSELARARLRGEHYKGKYQFLTEQRQGSLDEACSQRDLLSSKNVELQSNLDAGVALQESQAESIRRFEEQASLAGNYIIRIDSKIIELQHQLDYWMHLAASCQQRCDDFTESMRLFAYIRVRPWQEDTRLAAHLGEVVAENATLQPGKIKIMSSDRAEVVNMVFKDALQVLHNMENAKPMRTQFPEAQIAIIVEACRPLILHASSILDGLKELLG